MNCLLLLAPISRTSLASTLIAVASAISVSAQTIVVSGDVHASDLRTDLAQLTSHPSYPYQKVDNGSGMGTEISGFTSLSDAISTEAARLTYSFGNLDLTTYTGGGPGTSIEIYTPDIGSTFKFSYDGVTLATGTVTSLTVNTNYSTGAATGTGRINLVSGGTDASFFNEINSLSGGTNNMDFAISSFTAVNASGDFNSTGTFSASAVPEPSTYAAVFGLAALGLAQGRRRARGSIAPTPAPAQTA